MDFTEKIGEALQSQGIRAWACSHIAELDIDMEEVNNIYFTMQHEVAGTDLTIFVFESGKITVTGSSDA
jgi:TATA-box binding protein (TBP) (component of TFIID and TFIIIB)